MVVCRLFQNQDAGALADLFMELQAFHGVKAQSRERILRDIGVMPPSFEVWVAEDEARCVVGFALACVYPGPGIGAGAYLKELFVTRRARGGGVGRALMRGLVDAVLERGCERIDWVTGHDNLGARHLYESMGAVSDGGKLFYRLEGDALRAAAQG